jgi:hypothetical protein
MLRSWFPEFLIPNLRRPRFHKRGYRAAFASVNFSYLCGML